MTAVVDRLAEWKPELHPRDKHGRFRDAWRIAGRGAAVLDRVLRGIRPKTWGSETEATSDLTQQLKRQRRRTPAQDASLKYFFSQEGNWDIQSALRANADLRKPGGPSAHIKNLDDAMRPTEQDMILTHVTGFSPFGTSAQNPDEVDEWTGKLISDLGYMSTSAQFKQMPGNPNDPPHVTMSLLVPRGTRAVIRGDGGSVVLDRHQPVRIIKVTDDGHGGKYIHAVVMPQVGGGEAPRGLGTALRPQEKSPAIEATPEELARRGLNPEGVPIPHVPTGVPAGEQPAMGPHTPSPEQPVGPPSTEKPTEAIKRAGTEVPRGAGRVNRPEDLTGAEAPPAKERGGKQVESPEAARLREQQRQLDQQQARVERQQARVAQSQQRLADQQAQLIKQQQAQIDHLVGQQQAPAAPEAPPAKGPRVKALGTDRFDRWADTKAPEWTPEEKWNRDSGVLRAAQKIQDRGGPQHEEDQRILDHAETIRRERSGEVQRGEIAPPPEVKAPEAPPAKATRAARMRKAAPAAAPEEQPAKPEAPTAPVKKAARGPISTRLKPAEEEQRLKAVEEVAKQQEEKASARQELARLKHEAGQRKIPGRSKMSPEELRNAIAEHDRRQQEGGAPEAPAAPVEKAAPEAPAAAPEAPKAETPEMRVARRNRELGNGREARDQAYLDLPRAEKDDIVRRADAIPEGERRKDTETGILVRAADLIKADDEKHGRRPARVQEAVPQPPESQIGRAGAIRQAKEAQAQPAEKAAEEAPKSAVDKLLAERATLRTREERQQRISQLSEADKTEIVRRADAIEKAHTGDEHFLKTMASKIRRERGEPEPNLISLPERRPTAGGAPPETHISPEGRRVSFPGRKTEEQQKAREEAVRTAEGIRERQNEEKRAKLREPARRRLQRFEEEFPEWKRDDALKKARQKIIDGRPMTEVRKDLEAESVHRENMSEREQKYPDEALRYKEMSDRYQEAADSLGKRLPTKKRAPGEEKQQSMAALKREAGDLKVPGRSTMERAELEKAVAARRRKEGETEAAHAARVAELNKPKKVAPSEIDVNKATLVQLRQIADEQGMPKRGRPTRKEEMRAWVKKRQEPGFQEPPPVPTVAEKRAAAKAAKAAAEAPAKKAVPVRPVDDIEGDLAAKRITKAQAIEQLRANGTAHASVRADELEGKKPEAAAPAKALRTAAKKATPEVAPKVKPTITREATKKAAAKKVGKALPARFRNKTIDAYTPGHRDSFGPNLDLTTKAGQDVAVADAARRATLPLSGLHTAIEGDASKTAKLHHLKGLERAGIRPELLQGMRDAVASGDKKKMQAEESKLLRALDLEQVGQLGEKVPLDRTAHRIEAPGVRNGSEVEVTSPGYRLKGGPVIDQASVIRTPRTARGAEKAVPEEKFLPSLANGTRRKSVAQVRVGDLIKRGVGQREDYDEPKRVTKVENGVITFEDGTRTGGMPQSVVHIGEAKKALPEGAPAPGPSRVPEKAPGTAEGKLTASRITPGTRILMEQDAQGHWRPTNRTTNVTPFEITGVGRASGRSRSRVILEGRDPEGNIVNLGHHAPAQTFRLAPEGEVKRGDKELFKARGAALREHVLPHAVGRKVGSGGKPESDEADKAQLERSAQDLERGLAPGTVAHHYRYEAKKYRRWADREEEAAAAGHPSGNSEEWIKQNREDAEVYDRYAQLIDQHVKPVKTPSTEAAPAKKAAAPAKKAATPIKKAAAPAKAAKAAAPEKPKITKAGFDAKATRAKLESAKTRDEAKQALDGLTIAQLREVSPEGTRGGRTKADMVHRVVELHAGGRLEGEALRGLAPGGKPEPTKAGAANPPELGGEGPHGPAAWISRMRRAPTEGKIASNPDDIKTGQFIYRDSSGWGHIVGGPEKDRYQGEVYRVVFPNDQGGPGQYSRKVSTAEAKKSIEEHAKLKDYAEKRNAAGATDGGWTPGHGPQAAKPTITKKAAPAKATAPEAPRIEFPRSLDTATKRKAYVAEQAKMSLDDFHALPQEKRDEIIKNLRDIGNHDDVPRATRDSMGSLVRGATRSPHNDHAKFLAKHLSEPYTPKPVRPAKAASTEEALARIRAIPADSKNPNEAIDHALTGMTNREIGKVAAEGGWYERGGYDVRGQTRASLIERIRQGTHPTAPHVAERTTPEEVTPALTRPSATRVAKAAPELPKPRHISADEVSKALHEENTRSLNLERARTRAAEIDTPAAHRVVKNYEKGLLTEEDLKNELDLAEAEKAKAAPAKKAVAAVERTTPEAITPSLTKAAPAKRVAKKAAKAAAPEAGPEEAPPLEERTQPKMLLAEAKQRSAHDAITGHKIFKDPVDGKAARQLADGVQEKRLSPTIAHQKAQKISTEAARRASVAPDEAQARRWSRVANDYQDLANAIRDSQSTVSLDRYRFGHRGPEVGAPAPAAFHEGELSPAGRFVELRREAMRTEGEPNVGGLSDTQLHGIDEILKKDVAEGKVKPFDRHVRAAIDKELAKRAGTAVPAKKALPPASRQLPGTGELQSRVQKELDLAGGTRVHRLVQAQMGGDNNSATDVRRRADILRAEAAKLHASRRRSVAGHREDTLDGDKLQQAAATFDRHADMLDKRRAAAAERIAPEPAKKATSAVPGGYRPSGSVRLTKANVASMDDEQLGKDAAEIRRFMRMGVAGPATHARKTTAARKHNLDLIEAEQERRKARLAAPAKKVAAPRALTPRQQEVKDARERLALRRLQAENRDIPTRGKSADRLEADIKAHDEGLRKPAAKKVAAKAIPVAEKAAPTKAVPAKKVAAKAAAPEEASIDRPDIKAIADRLPDRYKQQISKILSGGSTREPMRSKVQKAAALRRDAAFLRDAADRKQRVLPDLASVNEEKVHDDAVADHLDRIADLVYLRPGTTKSRKKLPEVRKTLDQRLHEAGVGQMTNEPGYKDILDVRQERGANNLKAADVRRRAAIFRARAEELRTAHERHGRLTGKKAKPRPEDIAHAQNLEKAAKIYEEHAASLPDANVPEKPAREPRVTKAHLMDRARQLDIPGRSKMSTDELKAAVAEREKGPEVGAPAPSVAGLPEGPAVPRRHTFQISRSTAADTGRTAGDQPLRLPNGGSDQGRLHLDSEIGQLWTDLVSDKREPNSRLNNITRIGEDVGTGKMSLDEAAGELRKMAKTAPDKAVARRLEHTADAITAGPTPKIESPEGTPPAVHKFLQDLAAIPTMRKKDPLHPNEVTVLERARRLVQDAHNNPTATSDFQREVPNLAPHESVDGGYEAQRIVHRFASAAREDPSVRRWLHAEPARGEFKVGEAPKAAAPKGERLMPHNEKMSPEGQKLDAMSYEERVANLKKFTQSGPDYQRRTVDSLDRAAHFHRQGDGQATNAQLIEAEIAAKQRPEGDWQHRYPEEPKTHIATPAAAPEAPKKATTPSAGHQERLREHVAQARARLTPAQKQEAADQRERLRLARLQAGNRNIRGRSKMNVDQLEAAIAEHDKNEAAKKAAAEAKKAAPAKKAVRAVKKATPPKEETPLSQDELHAIRDLSHKGNFTDNGWVHHDQLNETQRKHLDSVAGKGFIDKHGTGDSAMYRIKPGQGRGGEKGGVLTGEIVPQQKEHGSQLSTDKVNRGGLIHGYMTSDGHFTNELKDASAEEKKAKRVRVIVQRTEHVGADGKPVEGLFNQTHARIIGHDADTGKRIESKVLPRGSSWDWEFNPTEQTSADIEGTATETPERKAVAAAKAVKKAAPRKAAAPKVPAAEEKATQIAERQRARKELADLQMQARERNIRGRSKMNAEQLKQAVAEHDRSKAEAAKVPAKKAAAVKAVQRSARGGISMSANDQAARTQGFQDRTDEAFSKLREAHGSHRPSDEVLREMKDHAWRLQGSSGDGRSFMFAPEDGKAGIAVHLPKEEGGRLTFTPREGRFTSYVGLKRYIQQHHAEAMAGGPGLRRNLMAGEPEHLPASQSHAGSDARIKRALEQIGVSAHPNLEHKPFANLTDRDIERLTPEQRSRLVTDLRRRVEAAHSLDRKRKFRDLADRIQGGRPGTTEAPKTPATKAVRRAVKAAEPGRPRAEAPKTPSLTPQTGAKEKPVIRNAQSHQELQDIAKLTNFGRERYRVHRDAGMSHDEAVKAADADLTARLKETETPSGTAAENAAKRLTARQTHNRLARASGAADVAYDLYQLYQARRKNDNPEAFRTGLRERIAPHPHQISPRDHEMLGQEDFKKLLGDEKGLDTPDKMEAKVRDSLKKLGIDVHGKPGDKVPYDPETMSHNLLGQTNAPKPGDMVEIQRPAMTHTDQDGKVRVLKMASVSPVRGGGGGGGSGPSGPTTPDDGLEKKTMKQLREMLPADRKIHSRVKKAELISLVRDEQGTGQHHASMDSEVQALHDTVRGGKVRVKRKLGDGTMGQVDLVHGSNGKEMVRKRVLSDPNPQYDISAKEQSDSENLVSRLARAIGIKKSPAVYQQGDHTVYMDRVHGKLASQSSARDVQRALESPQGRRLAILDLITGQTDRNDDNWMIAKDENGHPIPIPIDNSLAFRKELRRRSGRETSPSGQSPFDRFLRHWGGVTGTREPTEGASNLDEEWAAEHHFPKKELQDVRQELVKLEPEFKQLGREDWHQEALSRVDALIKRAKDNPGAPPRTPGEGLPAPTHTMGRARAARVVARTPQRGDSFVTIQDMLDEDTPEGGIPVHEINLEMTATGAPTETYHVVHGTVHRHNGVTTLVEHPDTPAGRNGAAFAYKRLRKYQESMSREDSGIQTGYALLQDDNPHDSYWSNKYGLQGFASAATGGRGSVWMWRQSAYPFREDDLDHEFGHNAEWSVPQHMQSSGARWHRSGRLDDAARRKITDFKQTFRVGDRHHIIRTQRNASGKYPDGVTNYGTSSPSEDFAESQMLYRAGVIGEGRLKPGGPIVPIWFRDLYPERAKMIDEMFPDMARQQLATIQRLRAEGAYA